MPRLHRITSARFWLATASAVVLLLSALALVLQALEERADAVRKVEAHVERVADIAARQVEQVARGLQRIADIAAESLEQTWSPASGAALEAMALLNGLAGAMPGIVDIAVIDAEGRRVFQASIKTQEVAGLRWQDAEVLRRHRAAAGYAVEFFGASVAGRGRILVSRRIEDLQGDFAGVVAVWFDAADLVRLPALDDDASVAVAARDGTMLDIGGNMATLQAATRVHGVDGEAGGGWSRLADPAAGIDRLLLRRHLANGLHVDVVGDVGGALEQWRKGAVALGGLFALGLVPFAAILWLLLREIRHREDAERAAEDARAAEFETMRGEARRLALVARHTGSGVVIAGPDERIEWINPAFTTITGYGFEEARGRLCGQLLQGPDTDPAVRARMRAALDRGEGFGVEIVNYAKGGRRYWAQLDCAPVRGADGRIAQFVAIFSDITLRKEQEARLAAALQDAREANAMHRRFVAMASHEFRTPLAIIDGAAQRLLVAADARTQPRLARIRAAVVRMTDLIDRTLSSARLEEGRIGFDPVRLDLAALLREAAGRQRELSPDFEIALALPPEPLLVHGDARLIEQIASNLLSNAVKYSGASRRIEVCAERTATGARIAIADHGVGVPPDEIDRLFTRYFRARTAMGIPGTGIGLNLVREFVAMHGGTVAVRSQLGRGSCFTVDLPARPAGAVQLDSAA